MQFLTVAFPCKFLQTNRNVTFVLEYHNPQHFAKSANLQTIFCQFRRVSFANTYVYSFFSPSISASFLWSMLKKHKPCKSMINLQNFRLIYRSFWSCFKSVTLTVPLLLQHTYRDLRAAKYQWLIEGLKISHLDAQKTFLELKSRWKKSSF